jgi:glycosyltransferase involved in cell wall biosynthesis
MLLYMASGVPPVVSPVGMNAEVLSKGDFGRPATAVSEWRDALIDLLREPRLARELGDRARIVAEEHYSVGAVTPLLCRALRSVA